MNLSMKWLADYVDVGNITPHEFSEAMTMSGSKVEGWEREGAETKYPYVVHAELNAILNAGGRVLRGARLYVALFPCNECSKAIIQSGIREIIYFSDKYAETANIRASKRMLDAAGVHYHPLQTELASITLDFRAPESAGIPQKSDADEK